MANPRTQLLRRVLLVSAMIVAAMNAWTGGPLLALWVGSKVQGQYTTLKMGAVGATVLTLASVLFVLYHVLIRLDARYGELIGRPPHTRQRSPWLRSLRDRYGDPPPERQPLTALEWILVGTVVLAFGCFEIWFFIAADRPCRTAEDPRRGTRWRDRHRIGGVAAKPRQIPRAPP